MFQNSQCELNNGTITTIINNAATHCQCQKYLNRAAQGDPYKQTRATQDRATRKCVYMKKITKYCNVTREILYDDFIVEMALN